MERIGKTLLPSFEQLPALIAELSSKIDSLTEVVQHDSKESDGEVLGIRAVAEYLTEVEGKKVTVGAVYNRVHRGILPCRKSGGTLYFIKSEITERIKETKRKAQPLLIKQKT